MKKWYKMAGALLVVTFGMEQVNGQGTHYGVGAGTQGANHSFFGVDAGKVNTGGSNSFFGNMAGGANSSGAHNTFLGSSSGINNTIGVSNVFIGSAAGAYNIEGIRNVFIGADAGILNKSGGGNVAIGHEANYSGETGVGNCSIGRRAGYNNNGLRNSFFGTEAGYSNTSGQLNSFVGSESGYFTTIGIANSFYGNRAGYLNEKGSSNSFFGYESGYNNNSGEKNTYLGYGSGGNPDLVNATAVGALAKVTSDNSVVLGSKANVGIGTSAPAYQLQLSTFAAAKAGTSTWIIASDQNLKKDISDYTDGLNVLKQIKPVWFSYNGQAGMPTNKKFVGIIAQDMQKIAPYTVGTFTYQDSLGNKTDYLDYDANAVTYMLINSVKEQQQIIEEKETKIQEMSVQMEDLNKRLAQLERIVASGTTKPLTTNPAARQGEPNQNGVILYQNTPNGFSSSTFINYFIPKTIKEAVIHVYSIDGVKLFSEEIETRGQGSLQLSANDFSNGVFIYDLLTDGKSNGAKKMVVSK